MIRKRDILQHRKEQRIVSAALSCVAKSCNSYNVPGEITDKINRCILNYDNIRKWRGEDGRTNRRIDGYS